jgi:hypothetical protein
LCQGRPARILLEKVHGIDSASVQLVTNHLNMKRINAVPHQNIVFYSLLKQISWAKFDQLVEQHGAARTIAESSRGLI